MRLRKCYIDVNAPLAKCRRLLALVATSNEADAADGHADVLTDVLVYFHGFPDMAVHPTQDAFASRMPLKLADTWLAARGNSSAFVTFNFGGVPGSDHELRFTDKTISQEVNDAVAVCAFVKRELRAERVHVVGLSTGAIIASLLRGKQDVVDVASIAVIAGLLDLKRGIEYDFSPLQRMQFARDGACWKEFYLPTGCTTLPLNVELSLDGETKADAEVIASGETELPRKIFIRLDKPYFLECQDGTLDIEKAVTTSSAPLFLVIHGTGDQNVPFADGEALFAAAREPKTFVAIPNGNHLLSNSKHLKKAVNAILSHTTG
uniref:Serine aminopeptidase S33 domain-containing protein n=1 Tax=Globisporangium ultimum (strain ATCC 200006 / CBS 805.95 / DAOM BR144) TaxID=431595 RepID=K3X987_GLOUD